MDLSTIIKFSDLVTVDMGLGQHFVNPVTYILKEQHIHELLYSASECKVQYNWSHGGSIHQIQVSCHSLKNYCNLLDLLMMREYQ